MKKIFRSIGIIALAAVIGFSFIACNNNININNGDPKDDDKKVSTTSITLSGTITIKNNGQTVPYVEIIARTDNWGWNERVRIPSTAANSPWSINIEPFSDPTDIFFTINGYDNGKYDDDFLFTYDVLEIFSRQRRSCCRLRKDNIFKQII